MPCQMWWHIGREDQRIGILPHPWSEFLFGRVLGSGSSTPPFSPVHSGNSCSDPPLQVPPLKGQLGRLPQSNHVSLTLFPHLPHLVEMDDEDGRCLLDVIW